jgi:hypothetical protein
LHLIAGREVSVFRKLFDMQLDHVFHGNSSRCVARLRDT